MMRNIPSVLAILCVLATSAAAHASTITETFAMDANGAFPVEASFTLTFDPTLFYTSDSADIKVNFLNSPLTSPTPPVFDYHPDLFSGSLEISEVPSGAPLGPTSTDYEFILTHIATTSPVFQSANFLLSDKEADSYILTPTWLVVTAAPASTPEPASFALVVTGVLALTQAARRNLRKT
jgi:hypothetical protein